MDPAGKSNCVPDPVGRQNLWTVPFGENQKMMRLGPFAARTRRGAASSLAKGAAMSAAPVVRKRFLRVTFMADLVLTCRFVDTLRVDGRG